jgi:hypothetical protein
MRQTEEGGRWVGKQRGTGEGGGGERGEGRRGVSKGERGCGRNHTYDPSKGTGHAVPHYN